MWYNLINRYIFMEVNVKKRVLMIVIMIFLLIIIGLFFITGRARTDVYLNDFEVIDNGNKMILKVSISGSSGYIRKMKRTSGSMNYYYTFYSTYGINSKIGAKDMFEIELDENVDEIYFYTGNKGYKLVLLKDDITGKWGKVNYSLDGNFKLNMLDKEDIVKVSIDNYSQENNYYEYSDKYTLDKIYNIFNGLETDTVSKGNFDSDVLEMYKVTFFCDEEKFIYSDKLREDIVIYVYEKDLKYYALQSYNGIYEISLDDFNVIKSFIKK